MYVAILKLKVDPKKVIEARKVWNEELVPKFQVEKGLKSAMLLVDDTTGEALSIGFWSDREIARGFESSGHLTQILKPMDPYLLGKPVRTVYNVAGVDRLPIPGIEEGLGKVQKGVPVQH